MAHLLLRFLPIFVIVYILEILVFSVAWYTTSHGKGSLALSIRSALPLLGVLSAMLASLLATLATLEPRGIIASFVDVVLVIGLSGWLAYRRLQTKKRTNTDKIAIVILIYAMFEIFTRTWVIGPFMAILLGVFLFILFVIGLLIRSAW